MTQKTQNSKSPRVNISLTGDNAELLREIHTFLKQRHTPVKVATTDVVGMALALLKANLLKTVD